MNEWNLSLFSNLLFVIFVFKMHSCKSSRTLTVYLKFALLLHDPDEDTYIVNLRSEGKESKYKWMLCFVTTRSCNSGLCVVRKSLIKWRSLESWIFSYLESWVTFLSHNQLARHPQQVRLTTTWIWPVGWHLRL